MENFHHIMQSEPVKMINMLWRNSQINQHNTYWLIVLWFSIFFLPKSISRWWMEQYHKKLPAIWGRLLTRSHNLMHDCNQCENISWHKRQATQRPFQNSYIDFSRYIMDHHHMFPLHCPTVAEELHLFVLLRGQNLQQLNKYEFTLTRSWRQCVSKLICQRVIISYASISCA